MIQCNTLRISGPNPAFPGLSASKALSVDKGLGQTGNQQASNGSDTGCSQPSFMLQAEQLLVNFVEVDNRCFL